MTAGPADGAARGSARPSFWRVAAQPKWLLMLALCLAVTAAFAGLGKWQLDAAIASAERPQQASLDAPAEPLGDHLQPQEPLFERSIGANVRFAGILDPADLEVLDGRLQGDRDGAWIVGRAHVVDDGAAGGDAAATLSAAPGMAVALGWAPDAAAAQAAVEQLRAELPPVDAGLEGAALAGAAAELEGTLEYGQAPTVPGVDAPYDRLEEMAPAYLVNRWSTPSDEAYSAYVTLASGVPPLPAGVEPVQRQLASAGGELNWLNIFYAIEWAIFALFALYLWWRLVRDDQRQIAEASAADPAELLAEQLRRERLRAIRDARRAGGDDAPGRGSGAPGAS